MNGAEVRLNRLFDAKSGRAFVAAFDHGVTGGPKPRSENVREVVGEIIEGGPEGILITPGVLKQTADLFAHRGAPDPIVRVDWIHNHEVFPGLPKKLRDKAQGEQYEVICSPEEAVALGAEAITCFLIVGHEDGAAYGANVRALASLAEDARRVGVPLICESVLWGSRVIDDKQDAELLAFGARVAAELGADAVKTAYTGEPETMKTVIDGCPVPVLVLGGARAATPEPVIAATKGALAAGAKGVVYGRNVWQSDDRLAMCKLLRGVIHGA